MLSTIDSKSSLSPALQGSSAPQGTVGYKAVMTGASAWAVMVCAVAYLVETYRPSAASLDSAASSLNGRLAPPLREATPVRFGNPFDPTEVFEFPPGTSEAEAHEAVAQMLLTRARDRLGYLQPVQHTASVASSFSSF